MDVSKAFLRELSQKTPSACSCETLAVFYFQPFFQLPDSFSLHAAARMCRPWKGLSSLAPKVGLPLGVPAASVHGGQLSQPPGPWAGLSPRGRFPSRFQRGQCAGPGGWCLGWGARSGAQVLVEGSGPGPWHECPFGCRAWGSGHSPRLRPEPMVRAWGDRRRARAPRPWAQERTWAGPGWAARFGLALLRCLPRGVLPQASAIEAWPARKRTRRQDLCKAVRNSRRAWRFELQVGVPRKNPSTKIKKTNITNLKQGRCRQTQQLYICNFKKNEIEN